MLLQSLGVRTASLKAAQGMLFLRDKEFVFDLVCGMVWLTASFTSFLCNYTDLGQIKDRSPKSLTEKQIN